MGDSADRRYQAIYAVVRAIPRSRVTTYGLVAQRAGLPRRARLVGRALREAPDDADLPWHRVVGAGGRISLPADSPSFALQLQRLQEEGVACRNGRIDLNRYGWGAASLDELLWGLAK